MKIEILFIVLFICGNNSTSLDCANNISRLLLNVCPVDDIPFNDTDLLLNANVTIVSNETDIFGVAAANKTSPHNDTFATLNKKLSGDLRASDDEPQIASFDEWTTQKLLEHHIKVADNKNGASASGGNVVPSMAARNYASKECGAKVVLANPEAQNAGAVLNEKERDEYMLNPCLTEGQKWIVVELCETIQITKIEIANFELFSSRPKDVKVWSSERYPSPEWALLGAWVAEDKREVHGFDVKNRLYAKYLKVELLSHYGTEHFCPLSLLRVLGVSMVEEYEIEASMSQEQQPKALTDQDVHSNESNAVNMSQVLNESLLNFTTGTPTAEPPTTSPPIPTTSAFGGGGDHFMESAKKAVVLIAKEMYGKAHQVFLGGNVPVAPSSRETVKTDSTFIGNKSVCILNSSSVTSSSFCLHEPAMVWSDCIKCRTSNYDVVSKACGYFFVLTASPSNGVLLDLLSFPTGSTTMTSSASSPFVTETTTEIDHQDPSIDEKPIDFDDYDSSSAVVSMETVFPSIPIPAPFNFLAKKLSSSSSSATTVVVDESNKIEENNHTVANFTTVGSNNHSDISPLNETAREIPTTAAPPAISAQNLPPLAAALPGVATSTKESVFVRLNNRIKMLELNISLSSQYLSELSKKYRKQMEDIQRAFNKTSEMFNETDAKFEDSLNRQVQELELLKHEVANMKPVMTLLVKDCVMLQSETVHWISIFVLLEVLVVVTVLWCCCGRRRRDAKPNLHITQEELHALIDKAVTKRVEKLLHRKNVQHS